MHLYVFFDTDCRQDLEKHGGFFEHVPNLMCSADCCECEEVEDANVDCEHRRKRVHWFWQHPVGTFIDYLRLSRPFADKVYAISQTSRGYDAQIILRRVLEHIWESNFILDGSKILSMVVENLLFLYSLNYLPMILKSMPRSIELTYRKGHYRHFFNTASNLSHEGPYSEHEF